MLIHSPSARPKRSSTSEAVLEGTVRSWLGRERFADGARLAEQKAQNLLLHGYRHPYMVVTR